MGKKFNIIVFSRGQKFLDEINGILHSNGLTAWKTNSPDELFSLVKEKKPDITIIDSDIKICTKLKSYRNINSECYIIFIYPKNGDLAQAELLSTGADCYLEFPVSPVSLTANVNSHLNRKKQSLDKLLAESNQQIIGQKITENALRESQARLAGIINSAMDAVITVDINQRILLFNIAAEKMFQVKAPDVIGKPLDILIPERFKALHKKHIDNFGKTGITMRSMGALSPISGLRANGEEFPIEASISQVETGGQKLFTVIIRDITEKKKAEEALISSEAHYRLLFKKNPMPMWVFDTETLRFLAVNFAAIKNYGYTRDEFLSMTIEDIRPPEAVPLLRAYVSTLRAPYKSAGVWKHKKKDGTIIDVEVISHELEFNGKAARLVLSLDVTEKIKNEKDLRNYQMRLSKALHQ
jgi:PAS domain S-box-containing protein